jgi:hypothetical protein
LAGQQDSSALISGILVCGLHRPTGQAGGHA